MKVAQEVSKMLEKHDCIGENQKGERQHLQMWRLQYMKQGMYTGSGLLSPEIPNRSRGTSTEDDPFTTFHELAS